MRTRRRSQLAAAFLFALSVFLSDPAPLLAQAQRSLTYPELITALQTPVPNRAFQTKEDLIRWVVGQIRQRKVDKPLTSDREDDLRQAGAPDEMIRAIRESSPALPITDEPVDLGELASKAVNLVRPEYTEEARKARTTGHVKLALELDATGKVVSISRLTVLGNGLTESAIDAARRSTFQPAMRDGKPARGKGVLTFNFRLDLIDVSSILASANSYREKGQCDRAIPEYDRILKVDSKNVHAFFGRGACRLMFAQYDVAAADLSSALAAEPQNTDLLLYVGVAQDFQGDHLKAAANYKAAIQIKPDLDRQHLLQCLYIDRGQLTQDQARAAGARIVEACDATAKTATDLLKPLVSFKRGIAHRLRSEHDKAIAEFERLKASTPRFTAVNGQLQLAYNERGNEAFDKREYRKALDDVTRAINVDPSNSTTYINRCAIHAYGLNQYAEAIKDCSYAIRLSARSASAFSHRGYAYEKMNDRGAAIADYTKALELDPNNEVARRNLNRLQPVRPSMRDN